MHTKPDVARWRVSVRELSRRGADTLVSPPACTLVSPLVRGDMCSGSEAGSYLRLLDSCITQLKAQGPSRTCNESKEEDLSVRMMARAPVVGVHAWRHWWCYQNHMYYKLPFNGNL